MCTPLIIFRGANHKHLYIIIRDFIFHIGMEPAYNRYICCPTFVWIPRRICMKVEDCLYSHLIWLENLQHQLFEHHGVEDSIFALYLGTLSSEFGSETNHNKNLFSLATAEATTLYISVIWLLLYDMSVSFSDTIVFNSFQVPYKKDILVML